MNQKAAAYWIPAFAGDDIQNKWVARYGRPGKSPAKPFRLARQFDGLDLVELDRALGHHVVDVAIGRARDLGAIQIDLHRRAMILLGPGRGIADALHAG